MSLSSRKSKLLIPWFLVAPAAAFAHPESSMMAAGWAGFLHPLSGLDHVLAMIAVGLWAAHLRTEAKIALPVAFPAAMVGGAMLATSGWMLPAIEPMIAASVIVLGAAVASGVQMPVTASAAIVAIFAVFHGHAHATEAPGSLFVYAAGFTLSTILLHVTGVLIGVRLIGHARWRALTIGGSAIAATGLALLFI